MQQNGIGQLYCIDLPAQTVAVDDDPDRESFRYKLADGQIHKLYEVGHVVPESLKDCWTLILEDVRKALLELMEKLQTIECILRRGYPADLCSLWRLQLDCQHIA